MSLLPLRIAVAALLFAGMPAEAAPEGDAGARAAARSIVERLVEATPVWHPWERIDRANSPTRLVNEALAFAATPEGGSALRHVLAEAIGEPGEENDLKWYIRNWAADLSAFLLGRVPGKRRPEPGYEIRVIHGHAAFLRFESGYGFGGGVASPASEPSPLPDKEVRRLLLEGRTPFRPPLEPDAGSLLEDLRSETSTLGHLLEEELESGSWWEGVESSLCTGLGEAAVADAKFGRRLLAAWKGEDGRPRPTGTGERLLLLALGRWGSPEALAVLGGEARKSAAALARGEFDHDRLRLLGAAYHLADAGAEVLRVRDGIAATLDARMLHAFDALVCRDFAVRRLLERARAGPGTGGLAPLCALLKGDYPYYGMGFPVGVRAEVLDFLIDGHDAASGADRDEYRRALAQAIHPETGGTFEYPDRNQTIEVNGPLPDPVAVARVLRSVRGPAPGGRSMGRTSGLTPTYPDICSQGVDASGVLVHATTDGRTLRIGIDNVGRQPFTIDPTAFQAALGTTCRTPSAAGESRVEFHVGFGFTAVAGETDVPAESLRLVRPGESASFSIALPDGLTERTIVSAYYSAFRVRGGPPAAPLLERFPVVEAARSR